MSNINEKKFNILTLEIEKRPNVLNVGSNHEREVKNYIKLEKKKYIKLNDIETKFK